MVREFPIDVFHYYKFTREFVAELSEMECVHEDFDIGCIVKIKNQKTGGYRFFRYKDRWVIYAEVVAWIYYSEDGLKLTILND